MKACSGPSEDRSYALEAGPASSSTKHRKFRKHSVFLSMGPSKSADGVINPDVPNCWK